MTRKKWQWRCEVKVTQRPAAESILRALRRHGRLTAAQLAQATRIERRELARAALLLLRSGDLLLYVENGTEYFELNE